MEKKARELLANRVRQLRKERDWSQEDLANVSGLHRTYIGAIERGERNCGVDIVEKLASAFNLPVDELFYLPATEATEIILARNAQN